MSIGYEVYLDWQSFAALALALATNARASSSEESLIMT